MTTDYLEDGTEYTDIDDLALVRRSVRELADSGQSRKEIADLLGITEADVDDNLPGFFKEKPTL